MCKKKKDIEDTYACPEQSILFALSIFLLICFRHEIETTRPIVNYDEIHVLSTCVLEVLASSRVDLPWGVDWVLFDKMSIPRQRWA